MRLKEYKFKLPKSALCFAQMLNKHIGWSDSVMIIGTCIMYRVQTGVVAAGNYWGHLTVKCLWHHNILIWP